ncbi:MAG TPA: prenyltransferase [Chloroflexi bacterium]|nr:MAG: prenyltransferase [Chloroflexota bacterium]HDD55906.1 prenyltransferase [Chloroflexota bacterium]
MNFSMWRKALLIIPRISKEEWDELDLISRWLIATRAAVMVMTIFSAVLAGIFAFRAGAFNFWRWILVTIGLYLAHGTNNFLNDYTDFIKGVDEDNYYRAQYGPHPLLHGLMTKKELLTYAGITGAIAAACGIPLVIIRGEWSWLLMALGVIFVLFYTYPLKYIALGEITVFIVWGPLMIAGGYYVITGLPWDWQIVLASLPYAILVTSVLFGKHIDKLKQDKELRIHTLPVVLGETPARWLMTGLLGISYLLVIYLIWTHFFTPVMLLILLAIPTLAEIWPILSNPKPDEKPAGFPDVWPNYYVAAAFHHTRRFGGLLMLAMILDTTVRLIWPDFWI